MELVESPHPAVTFLLAFGQHQNLVLGSRGVQLACRHLKQIHPSLQSVIEIDDLSTLITEL